MYNFIKQFVNKITLSDIIKFGKSNNIDLSRDEACFLLSYLKNNWESILYGDSSPIINKIYDVFDKTKSEKIVSLFVFYKDRYKNYL